MFPPVFPACKELVTIAKQIEVSDVNVHFGSAVSSNTFPAPQELYEKIKKQNPVLIDMETSAFYQVAWLLKIRVLAVLGISNILNHDGSDDRIQESDVHGSAKAAASILLKIIDKLILEINSKILKSKSSLEKEVAALIAQLKLQPHPEGGYYARTYQSTMEVKSINKSDYEGQSRYAGTSIYYLLNGCDFSAWHSIKSDEIWHYYTGCSIKLYQINQDGTLQTYLLGDPNEEEGAIFQVVVKANTWFAAQLSNQSMYSLVGCTVCPGFDFKDFKLADRKELSALYPQHTSIINRLSRKSDEKI